VDEGVEAKLRSELPVKEALSWFTVWFDKTLLSEAEGRTTNDIRHLPFVRSTPPRRSPSVSKDAFRAP